MKELSQGVPQGSILGPVQLNIYLNDSFFLSEFTDLCNFSDVISMKLNQDKCHFLVSGYKNENVCVNIEKKKIGKVISRNC